MTNVCFKPQFKQLGLYDMYNIFWTVIFLSHLQNSLTSHFIILSEGYCFNWGKLHNTSKILQPILNLLYAANTNKRFVHSKIHKMYHIVCH